MDEVGIVNNVEIQDMYKTTDDVCYNIESKKGGISLDKSFEDMINETYEAMMKNRQLKTNKAAPVMSPLTLAQLGSVDVDPLARSSPKVTKLKLIKPKLEPSLTFSPHFPRVLVNTQAELKKIHSPSMLIPPPLNSLVQMSSPQQNPPPFIPRSYTWSGLDGLQLNPTLKHSPSTLGAKSGVGCSGHEVARHSLVTPTAGRRKLLPKPILSINQNHTTMIPRDSFKIEIVETEDTPKIEVLGQERKLELEFPIITSSWSAREDPVKRKKNEQERERRLEMAVYRESLRKMLPRTQFVQKVSSAAILQAAKDHCQGLQSQMLILESMKLKEERRQKILTWRLTDMNMNISPLSSD